jgi:hypothetical protein
MFQLEAHGLQTPLPAVSEERLPSQAPQLLLVTGAIAPAASQPAPVVVVSASPDAPAAAEAGAPRDVAARAPAEHKDPLVAATPPAGGAGRMELPKVGDRLITRADALLQDGDVSGARLLLERSMEAGDARATFMLAETFDPHVLSRMGTRGIRGDAQKARELYARAQALGAPQARERIEALK